MRIHRSNLRRYIAFIFLLTSAPGCTPTLLPFSTDIPAQTMTSVETPRVRDDRPRFREIFCSLLRQRNKNQIKPILCDDHLWRLSDEPYSSQPPRPLPKHDTRFRLVLVPGAFAECFPKIGFPFESSTDWLEKIGYRIEKIQVSGRSSSENNARQIALAVEEMDMRDGERLILIGYSKGATDILHYLVDYPDISDRVAAFLSVAGAINGSALADAFGDTYIEWFSETNLAACGRGDRGLFESLKRSKQSKWMAAHPLPIQVNYFSMVAFTNRENVQPALLGTYDLLKGIDPRNDSQLLFYDQVIPGSSLLGYFNSGHWDIAVSARKMLGEMDAEKREALRDTLFEAMVLSVVESLQKSDIPDSQ